MPSPSIDIATQHATMFRALRGVLRKSTKRPVQEVCAQALWTLDALGTQVPGGLDPAHQVKDGYPLGAALLLADADGFNAPFFDAWLSRYGMASLVPDHAKPVPQVWLESISKQLEAGHDASAHPMVAPMAWLLDHAPSEQLPPPALERLARALEAQRGKSGLAPGFSSLLDRLAPQLAQDPRRPMARWLSEEALNAQALDPAQPVMAPSGRQRTLRELVHLAHPLPETVVQSPAALPELPHRRLKELCRSYVLDPDIPVETARRRLWACMREKPEVLDTLLQWHAGNGGQPGDAPRIAAIVRARDAFGRSLLAFLATGHGKDDPAPRQSRELVNAGLLEENDIYAADGAGLIEQSMATLRLGLRNDPFHYASFAPWVSQWVGPEALVGPASRIQGMVEDLVDAMLPGSHPSSQATLLHSLSPQPALGQALSWLKAANAGEHANPSWGWGETGARQRRREDAIKQARHELGVVLTDLVCQLEQHPDALAVGPQELRQWMATRLAKAAKEGEFTKRLADLERALLAGEMMRSLPPPAPASRPRM